MFTFARLTIRPQVGFWAKPEPDIFLVTQLSGFHRAESPIYFT